MAATSDDLQLARVAIPGPTLASILQRSSASPGDVDGLLFGHVSQSAAAAPSDDGPSTPTPTLTAIITSHISFHSLLSFYDPLGRLDSSALARVQLPAPVHLLGWFVARRRTSLRPSMRELAVTASLSNALTLHSNPLIFLLLSTPKHSDSLIHTHEYRAFQFRRLRLPEFEPKSVDVINIGPAFRAHYSEFSPNSAFPWMGISGGEDQFGENKESLERMRGVAKEQRVLDSCAEGFEIGRLGRMVGSSAANYASEVEDLYGMMLAKLDGLARAVEKSSARVLEQGTSRKALKSRRVPSQGLGLYPNKDSRGVEGRASTESDGGKREVVRSAERKKSLQRALRMKGQRERVQEP